MWVWKGAGFPGGAGRPSRVNPLQESLRSQNLRLERGPQGAGQASSEEGLVAVGRRGKVQYKDGGAEEGTG